MNQSLNTTTQSLSIISKFREYLLLGSKLLFIVISLFYLYNYKLFILSIGIPLWIKSLPIIGKTISAVESLGTYVLVIPLVIVIMSFYDDKSRLLKIVAGLFSFGGTIVALFHSISLGMLEEKFKLGFFNIMHE